MKQITKKDRQFRARLDLSLQIQKLLNNFKSKEEPKYKLTKKDKVVVLAQKLTFYLKD
jgi:hypothetical protein